jgi:ABC-type Zn uptake system ZnuABC Zn-binding protein ZnuA
MLKRIATNNGKKFCIAAAIVLLFDPVSATAQDRLSVVTTLPTYAAIAREVTGDLADVEAIARGDEDPHFVNPRPSFAAKVQRADLFVATGLDLELWVPAILDRANNSKVDDGGPGNVVAYAGVTLLEIPDSPSRAGGDVHVFGNPHIHTDPINGIIIARNIAAGLKRIDPENGAAYDANLAEFEQRVMKRLFGEQILELIGAETMFSLARNYQLWDFLQNQSYQGKPLTTYLGGWLAEAEPFRDSRMVCYHRNWAYLSARFRTECAMYVEPKPGIPPSPGHVREVIDFIADENISVLFAANYFSHNQVERVASRANVKALIVPEHVEGADGVDDYISLIDLWISRLAAAYTDRRPGHP